MRSSPDGKRGVGSSQATEIGKLHFAQLQTFSSAPLLFPHQSSNSGAGVGVGVDKRCLEPGRGEGWAERAQTRPHSVSFLSPLLNKICIPFLGEGQPCSPPNSPECGGLSAPQAKLRKAAEPRPAVAQRRKADCPPGPAQTFHSLPRPQNPNLTTKTWPLVFLL